MLQLVQSSDIFQLYDVVQDPSEQTELSQFQQERFERMKKEMLALWKNVNRDRETTAKEISKRIDQRK